MPSKVSIGAFNISSFSLGGKLSNFVNSLLRASNFPRKSIPKLFRYLIVKLLILCRYCSEQSVT